MPNNQSPLAVAVRLGGTVVGVAVLRPAAGVASAARRVEREARREIGRRLSDTTLSALDAALASRVAEEAIDRAIASGLAEHTVDRVFAERRVIDEAVARLLETEALWLLVDEIAQSPAVTEAIAHQSVGFADQVAGGVRQRTRDVDARLERAARRALRRPPRPESQAGP